MSDAKVCDNCGAVLRLNSNGIDDSGEVATWITLTPTDGPKGTPVWEACTRACAHELLDGPIAKSLDDLAECIAGVVQTLREEREGLA